MPPIAAAIGSAAWRGDANSPASPSGLFSRPIRRKNVGQQEAIIGLERASELVTAPLLRLEHARHGFSAFVVMPLFPFSNAGVSLYGSSMDAVTLAVVLGLAVGKPLGITGAAPAAVRLRLAALPEGVSWTALHGCAWLGGIGFTMSLFIATLAFQGTNLLDSAKIGILGGRSPQGSSVRLPYAVGIGLRTQTRRS